ncbi:MAG: MFS transporter [Anaerolineae bacterium]|nr:MFS transporter [Anaerolineae bacterium]
MASIVTKTRAFLNKSGEPGQINNKAKLFLALPMMPAALSNTLIHNAYIKFYTDMVGLDVKYVGILYLVFGIWNAINDPALGVFIDRFKFRKNRGKYVYLMRVTAPIAVLSSLAMIFAQPSWQDWVIFAFMLMLLFVYDTAATAYSIAYAAYVYVAAPTNKERVDVSVVQTYVGHIGGFFGTIVPTLLLVGESNRPLTTVLLSGVLMVNALLYFVALKPLQDKEEMYRDDFESEEGAFGKQLRSDARNALTSRAFITYILYQFFARGPMVIYFTPFLYMMDYVLRLNGGQATVVDVVPGLIMFACAPFIGRASKRFGIKKVAVYSAPFLAFAFLSLFLVQNMVQALVVYTAVIVFAAFGSIIHVPMMAAIVDEDEQRTGVRKAGLFTGLNALLTIPVGGMHTVIFTTILGAFTFVSGLEVQNDLAVQGIRIGASVIPFISVLVGIIPMMLSPITFKREQELSVFSEQQHRRQTEV